MSTDQTTEEHSLLLYCFGGFGAYFCNDAANLLISALEILQLLIVENQLLEESLPSLSSASEEYMIFGTGIV